MADITFAPAAAASLKPLPQTTVADMLNMARSAQAYQQAQQMNPIELQKAQSELGRYQALTPLEVKRATAEANVAAETEPTRIKAQQYATETAGVGTQSAQMDLANKQTTAVANRLTPLINNPLFVAAEQNPTSVNPAKMHEVLKRYAEEQAGALGIPKEKADQLIQPYLDEANKNPAGMRQFLKDKLLTTLDQGSRATAMGNVGVSTAPAAAPVAPQGVQASTKMALSYPVRSAAQPYIPEPTEAKDQAAGEQYRNSLVNRQTMLSTDRRNIDEAISQAQKIANEMKFPKGGVLGDVERKLRTAVASEDYKMLAKDLANLQISNLRALGQGGNTVAGMDLTKVASGDETVPPETLVKIARRAQSDMTNIDMQATGAEAFRKKFGDNNMNAYKQAWNANADSKIFEAMNIFRDTTDIVKRKNEIDKLLGSDPAKRKEFFDKYQNIKKLSETGSL